MRQQEQHIRRSHERYRFRWGSRSRSSYEPDMAMRFHTKDKHNFSRWRQVEAGVCITPKDCADLRRSAHFTLNDFNNLGVNGRNRPEKWQTFHPKWP